MMCGIIDLSGILKRDNTQISAALQKIGLVALHGDTYPVEQLVEYLYSRFLKQMTVESWNLSDIHVDMQDKLDMMVDFSKMDLSLRDLMATFQIPKDLVLLERTLLLLLGLCTHLSPYRPHENGPPLFGGSFSAKIKTGSS